MTGNLRWLADHRGKAGPIIDQGMRRTCLSCATSAAHHHLLNAERSIEFIHYESRKQPLGCGHIDSVADALYAVGQPPEIQWPYDRTVDESTMSPVPPTTVTGPFDRLVTDLCVGPDSSYLIDQLELGRSVVVGMWTTRELQRLQSGVLTEPGVHLGGHAVLLVGAAKYDGESLRGVANGDTLMCIQNSWGASWGSGGYGLIGPRAWSDAVILSAVFSIPTAAGAITP